MPKYVIPRGIFKIFNSFSQYLTYLDKNRSTYFSQYSVLWISSMKEIGQYQPVSPICRITFFVPSLYTYLSIREICISAEFNEIININFP